MKAGWLTASSLHRICDFEKVLVTGMTPCTAYNVSCQSFKSNDELTEIYKILIIKDIFHVHSTLNLHGM